MQLIQSNFQFKLTSARQRQLAVFTTVVLLVVALWWLAQLTWRIATPADTLVVVPPSQSIGSPTQSVNVRALQALNIFGDRAAPDAVAQTDFNAPETTLNVRLVGLVASDRAELSAAIIEQGGNQRTYVVGERITNSRASVEQILPDRVLLDNGGRREVLYIEGRDGQETALRTFPSQATATNSNTGTAAPVQVTLDDSEEMTAAVASVRDDPSALLELISITPLRENVPGQGPQVIGYRLQPRENIELFAALGLQAGDIAVQINGFDLTDAAQALAAMNELEDASRAIIQVRRNNELVDLELQVQ